MGSVVTVVQGTLMQCSSPRPQVMRVRPVTRWLGIASSTNHLVRWVLHPAVKDSPIEGIYQQGHYLDTNLISYSLAVAFLYKQLHEKRHIF